MRYACLACDFDGTLATEGHVPDSVTQALIRLRASGRSIILVTGRLLEDLFNAYQHIDLFDLVVCENGALLYEPSTKIARKLVESPPQIFVDRLKAKGLTLEVGRVIVSTWHPHETCVLETIQELGLDLHISFNKGAVMILPAGINKGTGLQAALQEMKLSAHNSVCVGDAENDLSMMSICECSAAVANALASVKEFADVSTKQDHGDGVIELIDKILANDLADYSGHLKHHRLTIGTATNGDAVTLPNYDFRVLIAGPSQSGKSTVSMSILKQFAEAGYQYCIIDPEGEYETAPRAVSVGNQHYIPEVSDIMRVLANPNDNAVVNLLGVPLHERAGFLARTFAAVQNFRRAVGRPHWLVIDEAHHMLHPYWDHTFEPIWNEPGSIITITVDPKEISKTVLSSTDLVLAVGNQTAYTLGAFASLVEQSAPEITFGPIGWGEVCAWFRHEFGPPIKAKVISSPLDQHRHLRKYADGNLGAQRSFYYTGAFGQLKIKCQNLFMFMQVGEGVDSDTWLFHLRRNDYSRWFRSVIGDENLADDTVKIEQNEKLSADESRAAIRRLIERKYTLPIQLIA